MHDRLTVRQAIALEGWQLVTEREIRSAAARGFSRDLVVALPDGRTHIPDLIAQGARQRIAVEIESVTKRDDRIRAILLYAQAQHMTGVCYLVSTEKARRRLVEKASELSARPPFVLKRRKGLEWIRRRPQQGQRAFKGRYFPSE